MTISHALTGLSVAAPDYPIILCDIWGVLHNGLTAYQGAVRALGHYRAGGGRVALVTNAPRPHGPIIEMLDRLGVTRDSYDAIVSSGDVTRALIAEYAGQTIHRVGPAYDSSLFEGIDVIQGGAEDAVAVVVTDMDDRTNEQLSDYDERMALWLDRGLPLICANPDKVVEVGDRMVICGGALAEIYEQRGGTVLMAGKPYAPIYDEALRQLAALGAPETAPENILAIGDAVRTDALGAAGQGMAFLFITGSVHAEEIAAAGDGADRLVAQLVAPSGANLIGHMPRLVW